MREFEYTFDDGLKTGLRAEESNPINNQALVELRNARPSQLGLLPYVPVQSPRNYVLDWPFPQYFRFSNVELMGYRESLWETIAGIPVKVVSHLMMGAIDGPIWSLADFGNYVIGVRDGQWVSYRDGPTGIWLVDKPHASIPYCSTVTNLNGQAFVGGLEPWGNWTDVGNSSVGWSDIGSASFLLDRKNEAGYARSDNFDEIVTVMQLGNAAIAYGHNSITAFKPVVQPAPTFSKKTLADFGIFSKGSVGGSKREHCFVSSDGYVYKMGEDLTLKRLGYQEQITDFVGSDIMVNHLPSNGDFLISDGNVGYVLTLAGMGEVFQQVLSLALINGVAIGTYDEDSDEYFRFVTDIIDFGMTGQKTVQLIEVGCEGSGTKEVAVDWRNNPQDVWERTNWVALNDQNWATLPITASQFRFCFRNDVYSDAKVSYLKIRYKMTDMRGIRGVYSPPPRGQRASTPYT